MSNLSTVNDRTENVSNITSMAQSQWFMRPSDQKFASPDALLASVESRRSRAIEFDTDVTKFAVRRAGSDLRDLVIDATEVRSRQRSLRAQPSRALATVTASPTHYAFGQLCSLVGAPAGYFRDKLSERPDIVVDALNHGIAKRDAEGVKLMAVDSADGERTSLYAVTSQTYGRIWDADVVRAAMRIVERTNGVFHSPLDWTREKRALFASDRDVFMFFCDGGSIVDGGGERDQLHRGFFMWNSEVGSKTFGIAAFLFRAVCGNFGIWGPQDVRLLRVRHTSGGPERFINEAVPALNEYVNTSVKPIEDTVRRAKQKELPTDDAEFVDFFLKRGFNRAEVKRAKQHAEQEEGQAATLWDMFNGFTASARLLAHADAKVDLETRAGKLLNIVSEN